MKIWLVLVICCLVYVLYLQRNEHSNEQTPLVSETKLIQQDQSSASAHLTKHQGMPLQPDAITDDRFDQALALHQKALEGDAKSQYLLGNIILECYFFLKTSSR